MAPEVLSQKPVLGTGDIGLNGPTSGPKVDVWSLGMILLETFLVRFCNVLSSYRGSFTLNESDVGFISS